MKIKQFRYSADNLGYLLYGERSALVIDGGAVEEILSFADKHNIQIKYAANTHSHPDHTLGTDKLINRTGALYLENKILRKNNIIEYEGEKIQVYHTPGHTMDSLCFYTGDSLITGDTLFNGTIGNCFSGDLDSFLKSVKFLMTFSDNTVIYAGHDYVEDSMIFAKHLEPDNKDIDIFLEKYNSAHICSTLLDERRINPYLRFNEKAIISLLKKRGLHTETEEERWNSLCQSVSYLKVIFFKLR